MKRLRDWDRKAIGDRLMFKRVLSNNFTCRSRSAYDLKKRQNIDCHLYPSPRWCCSREYNIALEFVEFLQYWTHQFMNPKSICRFMREGASFHFISVKQHIYYGKVFSLPTMTSASNLKFRPRQKKFAKFHEKKSWLSKFVYSFALF